MFIFLYLNKINNMSDSSTVCTALPVYICTLQVLCDSKYGWIFVLCSQDYIEGVS